MQPPLPTEAVRELVCSCLHRDPVAADLRCSLFVAAAQNYKRDSLLRPFPPRYMSDDNKDFEELVGNFYSFWTIYISASLFTNVHFKQPSFLLLPMKQQLHQVNRKICDILVFFFYKAAYAHNENGSGILHMYTWWQYCAVKGSSVSVNKGEQQDTNTVKKGTFKTSSCENVTTQMVGNRDVTIPHDL